MSDTNSKSTPAQHFVRSVNELIRLLPSADTLRRWSTQATPAPRVGGGAAISSLLELQVEEKPASWDPAPATKSIPAVSVDPATLIELTAQTSGKASLSPAGHRLRPSDASIEKEINAWLSEIDKSGFSKILATLADLAKQAGHPQAGDVKEVNLAALGELIVAGLGMLSAGWIKEASAKNAEGSIMEALNQAMQQANKI